MTILEQLVEHARERVANAREKMPLEEIRAQALAMALPDSGDSFAFEKALRKPGISFICE